MFLTHNVSLELQPYVDWFNWEDKGHPLSSAPEPKRRFIPSKWEAKKVRSRVMNGLNLHLNLSHCSCKVPAGGKTCASNKEWVD